MKKYGFAIVNNMNELFDAANQPDKNQRDYIHTVPNAEKNIVFESVELSDDSSSVTPHFEKDHVHARRQLKDIRKDSYESTYFTDYCHHERTAKSKSLSCLESFSNPS